MNDSRITRGLARQFELRRQLLDNGGRSVGWKAAFGAPASMERFRLDGPLVGFLTDASLTPDGATVDISTWAHPVAEPELAVYIGEDLPTRCSEDEARIAISAIGPAIELADIDASVADVESILAGNIFHRSVVLGAADPARRGADLAGLTARVRLGDEEVAATTRLEDLTGRLIEVVSRLSLLLADHDETMRAGEVVICGSIIPPTTLLSPTAFEFELDPMEPISITLL
jgi:2-keto-4-pentenoate hydratase